MKSSQIKTLICALTAITVLSSHSFAMDDDRLEMSQETSSFQTRLKELYNDKNRPSATTSTDRLSIHTNKTMRFPVSRKKVVRVEEADPDSTFEFYSDKGSVEISLQELLVLEPKVKQVLESLDQQVPAIEKINSGGFGTLLVQALESRKIFLESDSISANSCKGSSITSLDQQIVTACQSEKELRLSVRWLIHAEENARIGLINQQFILSWAQKISPNESKDILERKVQELNQQCLMRGDFYQLPGAISRLFGVRALDMKQYDAEVTYKHQ